MRTLVPLAMVVLLLPAVPAAQVSIGLRAGYGIPLGDAYLDPLGQSFSEKGVVKGVIPLQAEASFRLTEDLSAGLYGSYGLGARGSQLSDYCNQPGASCSTPYQLRYGAQVTWSFLSLGPARLWTGIGGGVESVHFKVKNFSIVGVSGDLEGTLRGWEVNLQGGVDWKVTSSVAAGPYLQAGIGQYRVQDISLGAMGTVAGGGIDSPLTHGFVTIGARGRFDI